MARLDFYKEEMGWERGDPRNSCYSLRRSLVFSR